jgi:hypothetical protein
MSNIKQKLLAGISYPESISYLGNKPNFTRDTFDTLEEMREALEAGYIDEGHLSYCKANGKHYKATKIEGTDDIEWKVFKPGGSNEGTIGIFTEGSYESLEAEDKPNDYILIPENNLDDLVNREVQYQNYRTSSDGNVIDILFSTIRALQSKVARLENTFATGVVSLKENQTAASVIIDEDTEEEEPLWAMDPEDLSEISDASLSITSAPDLVPARNAAYNGTYINVTGEASKSVAQFMDFEASTEAKQCMYLIANVKPESEIKVRLGYFDEDTGAYSSEGAIFDISRHLSKQKQNILMVLSRTVYDEDTEETFGKNYLWLSSTNTHRDQIFSKYIDDNLIGSSSSEKLLSRRYYIDEIILNNISVYRCNFYVKEQAFTNNSDIPSEKGFTDDFSYKAAHITIRSVEKYSTLSNLRSRLLQNELVWVEEENQLYIISTESKKIVALSSGGGGQHSDTDTMTDQELLIMLQDAGYVTADEKLNSVKLNDIEGLTFIHTESGNKFNVSLDSEGNLVTTKITDDILEDTGSQSSSFAFRGAVARYSIKDNKVGTTTAADLFGTTTNITALGDRVRFGSWYVPTSSQTQFNCSHDFIEIVNSGTVDYPLDNAILVVLKGKNYNYTASGDTKSYLSDATLDFFPLSGVIKKGSSYLIRAACRLEAGDPRIHINVKTYDKELWKNHELFSLQGTVGLVLMHKSGIYGDNGGVIFNLTPVSLSGAETTAYDVPILVSNPTQTDSYFSKVVNPYLIDVVTFKGVTLRNGANQNVWGAAPYTLTANAIIKDEFSLDPAKQAFKSLTSSKETSQYRLNKISLETIPLGDDKVSFYHSDQTYDITKFTPKASFENKNVCTDKTSLDLEKPNMPTVSFGIDMETTRCFNWISAGTFDEYVWIRKSGEAVWKKTQRFESYKSGDTASENGFIIGTGMQRKEFTPTVIDAAYARIEGTLPALGTPYCVHKCIVYIGKPETKQEYEYIVGRSLKNGQPNLEHCCDIKKFTMRNSEKYKPIIYHITDQQGFCWMEYQVWSACAKKLLEKINAETTEPDGSTPGTFPVIINTGDMTQNGTRINEWIDYYEGGRDLFDHLEQMNCVGNNDLGNSYDLTALGTGDDPGKSSPYFYYMCYCYEVDGDNISRGNWSHPLVYNNKFIPSTYYFYFGSYGYVSVNSEITDTTCTAMFGSPGYNLYTDYTIGGSAHTIDYASENSWCLARTVSDMIDAAKGSGRTVVVYCHEMPFTVITNDYLSAAFKFKATDTTTYSASIFDRCCQYSGPSTPSALIGSHLNRISYKTDYDNDDNYWFSRLLEKKGIRLCIGGHKHSYTSTWPVLEGNAALKQGVFADYDVSKLFVAVVPSEYYDLLPGTEITMGDKKYKTFSLNPDCYNLLATTDANIGNNKKNGVTYFMCQATGYKLKSNKELPSINQIYSVIVPKTKVSGTSVTAHFSQESPMFVVYNYGDGEIDIDLFRVINIKTTQESAIKEFSETTYSTKPVLMEKLLINREKSSSGAYFYENYWLVPAGAAQSDYSFNYQSSASDRCWASGNNINSAKGELQYLYSKDHTLIVEL